LDFSIMSVLADRLRCSRLSPSDPALIWRWFVTPGHLQACYTPRPATPFTTTIVRRHAATEEFPQADSKDIIVDATFHGMEKCLVVRNITCRVCINSCSEDTRRSQFNIKGISNEVNQVSSSSQAGIDEKISFHTYPGII
jgi:hypothetical protein